MIATDSKPGQDQQAGVVRARSDLQPAAPLAAGTTWKDRWAFPVMWVGAGAYLLRFLDRRWIPHDEGVVAQTAERILLGELPHRDFMDTYSGGLAYLHAFVFRVLGMNLLTPRIILFVFALLWIPVVYWIVRRFQRPAAAAGIVLVAVAWSLPNYFAPLPSWYNLFFATFGVAALLRYIEDPRQRWLLLAGFCGGLSILAKITGLFFVAAGLVFLAFLESAATSERPHDSEPGPRPVLYQVFLTVSLSILVVLLLGTVWSRLDPATFAQFVIPGATVVGFVLWHEWSNLDCRRSGARFRRLLTMVIPFCLGVVLPISGFLIPFVLAGAVTDLIHGVFVLPAQRTHFASISPPPLTDALPALLVLVAVVSLPPVRAARWVPWVACALLILLLTTSAFSGILSSIPVIVAAGIWLLVRHRRPLNPLPRHQHAVVLLLAVTAFCGLVQYPYATPIYFAYVAPLALMALTGILSSRSKASQVRAFPTWALAGALLLSGLTLNQKFFGFEQQTERLALDRGGLRIFPTHQEEYERLAAVLRDHSRSEYIFAGPDSPEVYFLSGFRNPTPYFFDFFADPATYEHEILLAIDAAGVTSVALNSRPDFSPPISPRLAAELEERFPRSETVGKFLVRWRE